MCQDCDQPAKMSLCRVMSRTKGTFKCHMCHATRTTMYRRLGAGWGKHLKCIPRSVRAEFFQFAKGDLERGCHCRVYGVHVRK